MTEASDGTRAFELLQRGAFDLVAFPSSGSKHGEQGIRTPRTCQGAT